MREVNSQILQDKIDEAVTHYISSHQQSSQGVHVDANSLTLNLSEDVANRVVTVMQNYPQQLCRQLPISEHVGEGGQWSEELLEPDIRIAALVAHLAQHSRTSHHVAPTQHKQVSVRGEVDSTVILDSSMRLYNGHSLEHQTESSVVQVSHLPPLPPLQDMKRCQDSWYDEKDKTSLKESTMLSSEIELASASPAQNKQSKKSLPHKKRISRKLKRNTGSSTPQQDIVVISCNSEAPNEQILPDNFVSAVPHQEHLSEETHHIAHEMRAILICQICGEFYGEDQLKFFHHLKQHYEPHGTIIIENPVSDLGIDKMTNTCIVDNVPTLPDSIVELSLENTVPKTLYQPIDKHIYTDKSIYNKVQYTIDKEPEKAELYESLDKMDTYSCSRCYKTFRKQKQCEAHIKEVHGNSKLEYMGEFSEPEDLMEGIHVSVEGEGYLPHLVVDNGHVTQDHAKHWYSRGTGQLTCGPDCTYCPVGPPQAHLKEEALQRMFDSEVNDNANFPENMMHNSELPDDTHPTHHNPTNHPSIHNDHTNNHQTNHPSHHQTNHPTDHQSDHPTSHQSNHPSSHQSNHPSSHQNNHQINHQTNHPINHQPDHLHNHQMNQPNHHLALNNHQTHQPHNQSLHPVSHQNGHSNSHQTEITNHEIDQQPNHQIDHQTDSLSQPDSNEDVQTIVQNEIVIQNQDSNSQELTHGENGLQIKMSQMGLLQIKEECKKDRLPIIINTKSEEGKKKVKRYDCQQCGKIFFHRNSLVYHVLSHGRREQECKECGKAFFTANALKIHQRRHSGNKPYKCDECGRDFRQWSVLMYHKNSIHSNQKNFKCEYCNKEFARKYSLRIHVRIHTGERNYKCDYCNKSFRASSYRLSHMRTHTGEKPYKCTECEKTFRVSSGLRRHMAAHDKFRKKYLVVEKQPASVKLEGKA